MSGQPSILSQRSVTALIFLTSPQPLWDRDNYLIPISHVERLRRVSGKARTNPRPTPSTADPSVLPGPHTAPRAARVTEVRLDWLSERMMFTLSETLKKYVRDTLCAVASTDVSDKRGPGSYFVTSIVLAKRRWCNNKDPQSPSTSWCLMGETVPLGPLGQFVVSRRFARCWRGDGGHFRSLGQRPRVSLRQHIGGPMTITVQPHEKLNFEKINLSSNCFELIRTGLSLAKQSFLSKQRGHVTRSQELSSSSQCFKFEFIIDIF